GYGPAEAAADKYHGVQKFDVVSGVQAKSDPGPPSYTNVFASALLAEAERDETVTAITAAMPSGTGLDKFGARFPERMFDVGLAEQHAVTFAACCSAIPTSNIRMRRPSPPASQPRATARSSPSTRPSSSAP